MHFFVSDLHMTDTGVGEAVSDQQLAQFVADIEASHPTGSGTKHKLIFVGDIFDLLRSPKWAELWKAKKSAPWSGSSVNFRHITKSYAEQEAVGIARAIADRYPTFRAALKKLVGNEVLKLPPIFPVTTTTCFNSPPSFEKFWLIFFL